VTPHDNPSPNPPEHSSEWKAVLLRLLLWLGLAALILGAFLTSARIQRLQAELTSLGDQVRQQRLQGLALQAEKQHQEKILAILRDTYASEFVLRPTGAGAAGRAPIRAFWSVERGLLLVGERLPHPAIDHVFQVWVTLEAGSAAKCGTFRPGREGRTRFVASPGIRLAEAKTVWISEEPTRSTRPASPPLWAGAVR
jgi:hypothetical protein